MKIELLKAGKRFNRDWIFRNANIVFSQGNSYAITGPNGSGKSTFLQCIAGMIQLSEGTVYFKDNNFNIKNDDYYQHVSFCAPYFDLIEEMTLNEFFNFHFTLKPIIENFSCSDVIKFVSLQNAADKQIRYFSSGMKQRVKLAQAFFSATKLILLDEPCSNLDIEGIHLYHRMIESFSVNRIVIISSNDKIEYNFCKDVISITDYKYDLKL